MQQAFDEMQREFIEIAKPRPSGKSPFASFRRRTRDKDDQIIFPLGMPLAECKTFAYAPASGAR
jgi:hypothetical protein